MSTQKQGAQQKQQTQQNPQVQNTQQNPKEQNQQNQQLQQQQLQQQPIQQQQQQQQQMQSSQIQQQNQQQIQQKQQQQTQMQSTQAQQQKQQGGQQQQPTKLQEKKSNQAMENAELNEYIKSYLKYNTFQNTLECFEAEINAKKMSSKLQDKKLLKDPNIVEQSPRLYQMLQSEESRTSRERKVEQNMKILNQKYIEMLQASRSLFSISVKLLADFMQASPQSEEKIDGYKRSIGQYRRLVLEEGKPPEKKAPTNDQILELKENIMDLSKRIYTQVQLRSQQDPNQQIQEDDNQDEDNVEVLSRQLKSELIKLRLNSLETGQTYRQEYLKNLIKLDVLDMGHIDKPNHYLISNLNNYEHFIKHQLIALISIICAIREGRLYIIERDTSNVLIKLIIKIMKEQEKGSVTQRFCLAVLHKISLHDELLPLLLEEKLHIWLVDLIKMAISSDGQKESKLHVFVLEYASATLANILSENEVIQTFYGQQQNSVQFLDSLLKCLNYQNSIQANKYILRSLSFFTKDKFNQSILETSYDEKINQFLDSVSKNTDEDYKTQVLTYHARIFTTEVNKQGLDMEQKDDYERGMKQKYDNNDDSVDQGYDDPDQVIIFEHFNDELTDELLKGVYNR